MLFVMMMPSFLADESQKSLVPKNVRTVSREKGVLSANPFSIHIDVSGSSTYARFQPLFNGTFSYIIGERLQVLRLPFRQGAYSSRENLCHKLSLFNELQYVRKWLTLKVLKSYF